MARGRVEVRSLVVGIAVLGLVWTVSGSGAVLARQRPENAMAANLVYSTAERNVLMVGG